MRPFTERKRAKCTLLLPDTQSRKTVLPDWVSQPADSFLNFLPPKGIREARRMGDPIALQETPQFPFTAFKFGGRLGAAIFCWYLGPVRSELPIGEIVFGDAGENLGGLVAERRTTSPQHPGLTVAVPSDTSGGHSVIGG